MQPPFCSPFPLSLALFDQFNWITHCEPLLKVTGDGPKIQSHLSPTSSEIPSPPYQPEKKGSVRVSESSCLLILLKAARPTEWPVLLDGTPLQPKSLSRL